MWPLLCPSVFANWVAALSEIHETSIPSAIRRNFKEAIHIHDTCPECVLGVLNGEEFFDIYPRRFLVLSLSPNSFGGVWAYIAVEGERKRTFRLWLYDLADGEYDLRSVEELPDSMGEKFLGQLQDSAHEPYWM